jgi:hypothetical protein
MYISPKFKLKKKKEEEEDLFTFVKITIGVKIKGSIERPKNIESNNNVNRTNNECASLIRTSPFHSSCHFLLLLIPP